MRRVPHPAFDSSRVCHIVRDLQRLLEVRNDIVDVLDADRQAYITLRDTAGLLLIALQLRVRGGGRVNGE